MQLRMILRLCFCGHGPFPSPYPATMWTSGPPGYLKLQWWACLVAGAVRSRCSQSLGRGCCHCSLSWQAVQQRWAVGWGGWSPIPPPGPAAFSGPPISTRQRGHPPAHKKHYLCSFIKTTETPPTQSCNPLAPGWGLRILFLFKATQILMMCSQSWEMVWSQSV